MVILGYTFVDINISKGLSFCDQERAFGCKVTRFFTIHAQLVGPAIGFSSSVRVWVLALLRSMRVGPEVGGFVRVTAGQLGALGEQFRPAGGWNLVVAVWVQVTAAMEVRFCANSFGLKSIAKLE